MCITIRLDAECVHSMIIRLDGGRNLIGRRTQPDWTADAIRLDGERNPIEQFILLKPSRYARRPPYQATQRIVRWAEKCALLRRLR